MGGGLAHRSGGKDLNQTILTRINSGLALIVCCAAVGGGSSLFPFDFIASYAHVGGGLSFSSEGALQTAPVCSGAWDVVNQTVVPVTSSVRIDRLKVSTVAKRYVVESQANFVLLASERVCGGIATNVPVRTECAYDDIWDAANEIATPRALPDGWSLAGTGSGAQLAKGTAAIHDLSADLRFEHMKVQYEVGRMSEAASVPFTGRMHFYELEHDDDIYSDDYIAGFCIGADASPEGCCNFAPTSHDVRLSARATTFGAPPLGSWEQSILACRTSCA